MNALKSGGFCAVSFVLAGLLLAGCDTGATPQARPVEITVLVAYTAPTAEQAPDILARAYRAIGETNAVYRNSGVHAELRIVHVMPVDYAVQNRLEALAHLVRPNDGVMDDIHALRDAEAADIVVLLTEDVAFTQNAAVMATPETAFVMIYYDHAGAPFYNIAHEVGHLQGARHQPERDPATEPFPYGHAAATDTWRTVVGTGARGLKVLPYFSSPSVMFEGRPVGDASLRDNAHAVSESAQYVANFRGLKRPTDFVPSATFPVLDF